MYASIGFSVFAFSAIILLVTTLFWVAAHRARSIRAISRRIFFVFAVFALAGGYVWTEAGPQADYRMQINEMPTLPLPTPTYYWA